MWIALGKLIAKYPTQVLGAINVTLDMLVGFGVPMTAHHLALTSAASTAAITVLILYIKIYFKDHNIDLTEVPEK